VEVSIMKSGKAEIYRPPGGRTERDVAAEVIARLLKGGVLSRSPAVVARAAAAVGVPVGLIREKWAVDGLATVPFDGTLVAQDQELPTAALTSLPSRMGAPAAPRYKPGYHPNSRAENEARRAKKEPVPGKRTCSGKCGQLKNLDQFGVKDKRTGALCAWCKECMRAYSKDRYLSSKKLEKLGPVLRFILEDGDEHAGMICPDCRQPCCIGDEVIATDAVLHHASHHEVGKP
jgi:hypothetical protein